MKKMFSVLASLLMISSCANLSAYAEKVVIAINDKYPNSWVAQNGGASLPMLYCPEAPREVCCRYMDSSMIADFNPSQEKFEFGDIIEFENVTISSEADYGGTLGTYMYFLEVMEEDQPYSIYKAGSIFDNPEIVQFTVTGKWNHVLTLLDDEGNHYEYKYDWLSDGYYQPDCVDVSTLHSGDVVSCITYNDVPMLVTEVTSVASPSGDANGDGTLNILDVIIVNQAILGKKRLTDTDKIYHVDFNQDGVPDATDSLTMLKMIVELE